jgi:hypothetical protein
VIKIGPEAGEENIQGKPHEMVSLDLWDEKDTGLSSEGSLRRRTPRAAGAAPRSPSFNLSSM